jgi:DNA-binding transcriptional LysR family regulator
VIDLQLSKQGFGTPDSQSVSFFNTLISMVESGFGAAIIPTFAMAACKRHEVNVDLLISPKIELSFYRISKRGAKDSEAIVEFVKLLRDRLPIMSG